MARQFMPTPQCGNPLTQTSQSGRDGLAEVGITQLIAPAIDQEMVNLAFVPMRQGKNLRLKAVNFFVVTKTV